MKSSKTFQEIRFRIVLLCLHKSFKTAAARHFNDYRCGDIVDEYKSRRVWDVK